ncbi:serine/threonine-protein kinase [Actinoalloteichus sp. GBA129-24]|uniref:serine/threonine-protein kinase n=1 Tax=Actinoalloteichus sp. GBA129-24 TaxID=1612551 RepID=UPI0009503E19|nr:serine/threonine-protein kinase [Actinoalloteichus sp. GBA129-24]APU20651.1 protein kinase family protein [Actinoalloteichus sp. GBA129-24]
MTDQDASIRSERRIAGRYVLVEEIGRGGMGVVWRAEDAVIGRNVAVKELRLPDGVPQQERGVLEERVLREARSAGRLNDPSVVTVFDVVSEGAATYIVMELVEAPTLADVVQAHGPLPAGQVVELGRQLLHALQTAHTAGIVHRDVKPSNIMVLPNGRAKLTDFGIAQAADDPRLTTTGLLVGSATYMAPERISENAATASSDLWALGATLFHAVEGRAPFDRPTTAATLHAILNDVPYLTRCQGPLASVIMGLLITAPHARLTSAQAGGLLDATASRPELSGPAMAGTQQVTSPMGPSAPMGYGPGASGGHPMPGALVRSKGLRWPLLTMLLVGLLASFGGGFVTHLVTSADQVQDVPEHLGGTVAYGPGGELTGFSLGIEECASGALSGRGFSRESAVPCEEDHDFEVVRRNRPFDLDTGTAYPGQEELTRYMTGLCQLHFSSDRIELPEDEADALTFTVIVPTAAEWSTNTEDITGLDDTNLSYCVLHRADGATIRGSMINTPED